MQNQRLTIVGVVLGIALFLAVNLLAGPGLRGIRADLTEQKLYTISEGTRNIIGSLEEEITLRYFFTRTLAQEEAEALLPYADRVLEMLEQYEAASKGRITLEVIDPIAFSEEEELAVSFGIPGQRVSRQGDKLYLGLVGTNSVDGKEVIPVLEPSRESSLEYELTELIDKLERDLPVLGLVSGVELRGSTLPPVDQFSPPRQVPDRPILQLVEQRYEIRDLGPATLEDIPEQIDLLLLVQPTGLTDAGLYAIDQFALAGGKVCAFVDSMVVSDLTATPGPPAPGADVTGIDRLLEAWGVPLKTDKIAGDDTTGTSIRTRANNIVDLPMYFDVLEGGLNDDDILTESLPNMRMVMAGAFDLATPDGLEASILAATSVEGGGTVGRSLVVQGTDQETLAASFVNLGEAQTLAVRLRGEAKSAFPDGAPIPAPAEGEEEAPAPSAEHMASSTAPFNAIVVSDVDMLHEELWARRVPSLYGGSSYRSTNGNAPFLVGALENLSGSDDLISLRSREPYRRPFLRKQELERQAQEAFAEKEESLERKLAEAERKINELQAEKDPQSAYLLSPEQQAEIDRFREQEVETRRELRKVKRDLKAEIEALGTRLELLNIALIPAIIAALALSIWLFRRGTARA